MRDTNTPPALQPLAELLKRRKISQIEYRAAEAYHEMNDDMRAAVDAKMRGDPQHIVHNLLVSGLGIIEAVTHVLPCDSIDVIYRLRGALAELSEAIELIDVSQTERRFG